VIPFSITNSWNMITRIIVPSTSIPTLGTGKWSAGPTVVVLKQVGPWTYGALWNQVWSFAGSSANWQVDRNRWTVPINVLVSKLSTFGCVSRELSAGRRWISHSSRCRTVVESSRCDRHPPSAPLTKTFSR
jgi:hypothetical protein